MVRRTLLVLVLIALGLALLNSAAVAQFPKATVPSVLVTVERYVHAEGSVAGAVFGLGLILIAFNPLRYRLWVLLAILLSMLSVAVQVDRYYGGQSNVIPPLVFWVAATALLMALFPTRGGAATTPAQPRAMMATGGPMPPMSQMPPSTAVSQRGPMQHTRRWRRAESGQPRPPDT